MRPEPLKLPPELQQSIRDGRCIAYIGSGASAGCYHSWEKLIDELCACCGNCWKSTGKISSVDYLKAADDAKSKDEKRYHDFLGHHFGRSISLTAPIYRALLSCNFKSYLTINFDPLLAFEARTAMPRCRKDLLVYPHLDRQFVRERSIYYLHGFINEGMVPANGSIVLAQSEFDQAYAIDSPLRNFLLDTLREEEICFIGCSLSEPVLSYLFETIKQQQSHRISLQQQNNLRPSKPPSRYICLPKQMRIGEAGLPEIDQELMDRENERYRGFDIQVLRYSTSVEGDHSALRLAFENLANMSRIKYDFGWDGDGTYGR